MKSAPGFALFVLYLPVQFFTQTTGLQCGVCNTSIHHVIPTLSPTAGENPTPKPHHATAGRIEVCSGTLPVMVTSMQCAQGSSISTLHVCV